MNATEPKSKRLERELHFIDDLLERFEPNRLTEDTEYMDLFKVTQRMRKAHEQRYVAASLNEGYWN